jgi:hypothetical protein
MNSIVKSLIYCSSTHGIISLLDTKINNLPNAITCILFQSSFVFRSLVSLFQSYHRRQYDQQIVANDTLQSLDYLTGYFLYDILFLLKTNPRSLFILHHIIGLVMISVIKYIGFPVELLKHYNAICVISEITNPVLNLRYLTKDTPYYSLNMKLILFTYTLFRVIAFPLVSNELLPKLNSKILWGSFITVYFMSLVWFKKIVYMTLFK